MAVTTDTPVPPRLVPRADVLGDALATFKAGEDRLWLSTIAGRLREDWPVGYEHMVADDLARLLDRGDRGGRVLLADVWGVEDGRGRVAKGVARSELDRAHQVARGREAWPPPVERMSPAEWLWRLVDAISGGCDRVMPILAAGAYLALIVAVAVLVGRGR